MQQAAAERWHLMIAVAIALLAVGFGPARAMDTTNAQCLAMFGSPPGAAGVVGTAFRWKDAHEDGTAVCLSKALTGAMMGQPLWQPVHAYIFTGDQPGNEGTIGPVSVSGLYTPGTRPTCIAQPAWTMPEFALGRSIPDWPMQATAVQASYDTTMRTIMVRFWSPDALMPNANYSINVICAVKQ